MFKTINDNITEETLKGQVWDFKWDKTSLIFTDVTKKFLAFLAHENRVLKLLKEYSWKFLNFMLIELR